MMRCNRGVAWTQCQGPAWLESVTSSPGWSVVPRRSIRWEPLTTNPGVATTCCTPPSSASAEPAGRHDLRSALSPDPRFRSPPSTTGTTGSRSRIPEMIVSNKYLHWAAATSALGVSQMRGADGDGRGGGDAKTQPRPLLGIIRVLARVNPATGGGSGYRRPPRDQADAVWLAVAAAEHVPGTPVARRLERRHDPPVRNDLGERALQGRQVALTDLIESDQVRDLVRINGSCLCRSTGRCSKKRCRCCTGSVAAPAPGRPARRRPGSEHQTRDAVRHGIVRWGRRRGAPGQNSHQTADDRRPQHVIAPVRHGPVSPSLPTDDRVIRPSGS